MSELLGELIENLDKGDSRAWDNVNQILFYLRELQQARQTIADLKADGERLAENLNRLHDFILHDYEDIDTPDKETQGNLDQHTALYKRLEDK